MGLLFDQNLSNPRSRPVYTPRPSRLSIVHALPPHNTLLATPRRREVFPMLDVVFLLGAAALFGVTVAYVAACDRM